MSEQQYKTILSPTGAPASIIFNTGTIRNPGTEREELIKNVLGPNSSSSFNPFSSPGSAAFPGQAMLSNIDTFNKNLRYYFASNFRQMLSQAYVEYGLVRTITDVPVEDGYRGGVTFKTDQLDEKEVKRLMKHMKRQQDLETSARGQKWGRLFGGGAILCFVKDQDPELPLDLRAITEESKIEFRAVDLWELSPNQMNVNEGDPAQQSLNYDYFLYYGEKIHKSRAKQTFGLEVPSFVRPRLRGWKASVVETLIRSINQYLKGTDLAYEVLDEFKLDIFMIDGWKQALSTPEAEQLALKRVQYANGRKNFQHATILDALDKFEQRQLTFAGLAEVMEGIRLQVASDLRMPLTKIFGISAQGFNAGQEDLENYNMMVEATVRTPAENILTWMTEIRCAELFQSIPDDIELEFKPLRVMSATDEQTVKTGKATILDSARGRGDIGIKEYRDAINSGKLMDVKLDNSDPVLQELEEVQEAKVLPGEDGEEGEEGGGAGAQGGASAPKAPEAKAKGKPVGNLLQRIHNAWNTFREEDHPRADDGKFGSGGGGSKKKDESEILELSIPGFSDKDEQGLLDKIKGAESKEDIEKVIVDLLATRDKLRKEGKSVGDIGQMISLARERYADIHSGGGKGPTVKKPYTDTMFTEDVNEIDGAMDIPSVHEVLKRSIKRAQEASEEGFNPSAWDQNERIKQFAKARIEKLTMEKEKPVDKPAAPASSPGGVPADPLKPEPNYRYTPERAVHDEKYLKENCKTVKETKKFIAYLDEYFKVKPEYSMTPKGQKLALATQIYKTAKVRQKAFHKLREQMGPVELPKAHPFSKDKSVAKNVDEAKKCYEKLGFDVALGAPPNSRFRRGTMACVCMGRIYINKNNGEYWGNVVEKEKELFEKHWLSNESPYATIHHEIGHVLYNPPGHWEDRGHKDLIKKEVSDYAATNPKEFVSEAHGGIKAGIKYSEEIMKLFNQYARKPAHIENKAPEAKEEENGDILFDPDQEEVLEHDDEGNILVGEPGLLNPGQ